MTARWVPGFPGSPARFYFPTRWENGVVWWAFLGFGFDGIGDMAWSEVADRCAKYGFTPQLLLYENVELYAEKVRVFFSSGQ